LFTSPGSKNNGTLQGRTSTSIWGVRETPPQGTHGRQRHYHIADAGDADQQDPPGLLKRAPTRSVREATTRERAEKVLPHPFPHVSQG
jgi:hypothetical protein